MKPLRVWGWEGWRLEAATDPNNPRYQTREIIAAPSAAAVARAAGVKYPRQLFNLNETGNSGEIAAATPRPGVILWRPLDDPRDEWQVSGLLRVDEQAGDEE